MHVRPSAIAERLESRRLLSATGTVSGTVFADPDQTGLANGNTGIAGREVYVDLSGAGVLQPADPTALTDSSGRYMITGVPAGSFAVRLRSTSTDGQTTPANFDQQVTVIAGGTAAQDIGVLAVGASPGALSPSTPVVAGATQPDGKLVVVGDGGSVRRFFADGTPDRLFGGHGTGATTALAGADLVGVAVEPDGQLDLIGNAGGTGYAVQLGADGSTAGTVHSITGATVGLPGSAVTLQGLTLTSDGDEIITGRADDASAGSGGAFATLRDPATFVSPYASSAYLDAGTTGPGMQWESTPIPTASGQIDALTYQASPAGDVGFRSHYGIGSTGQPFPLLEQQGFVGPIGVTSLSKGDIVVFGFAPTTTGAVSGVDLVEVRLTAGIDVADAIFGTDGVARYGIDAPGTHAITDILAVPDGSVRLLATDAATNGGVAAPLTAVSYAFRPDGLPASGVSLATSTTSLTEPTDDVAPPVFLPESGLPSGAHGGYTPTTLAPPEAVFGNALSGLGAAGASEGISAFYTSGEITAKGIAPFTMQITYVDPVAVAVDTLATGDVEVIYPAGVATQMVYIGITGGTGQVATAEYALPAPVGGWTYLDNGSYTIYPLRDVSNGSSFGSMVVDIPPPPSATLSSDPSTVTAAGATPVSFEVTYFAAGLVDPSTADVDDVSVTGPDDVALRVTGAFADVDVPTATVKVTYTASAPPGGFTAANSGSYVIALVAGQVADASGQLNVQFGQLGYFTVAVPGPDTAPPTAVLQNPVPVTRAGATTLTLTVSYGDQTDVAGSTIDPGDVTVTGPTGFRLTPQSPAAGATPYPDATTVTATYTFESPTSAGFQPSDDGAYTVTLVNGAVADTLGHLVAGAVLGTVDVATGPVPVTLAPPPDLTANGVATVPLVVTYGGSPARYVDPLFIEARNLVVSGANGESLGVVTAAATPDADRVLTVTYTVAAPTGTFTSADDGLYTVTFTGGILDSTLATVPSATLGKFLVAVPIASPSTPASASAVATTTTVSASAASAPQGILVPLSATVTSADRSTPTGNVTFLSDYGPLGSAPIDATGHATFSTAALPAAADRVTAVYAGDASHAASETATPATLLVVPPPSIGAQLVPSLTGASLPTGAVVAGTKRRIAVPVTLTEDGSATAHEPLTINIYASTDAELDGQDGLAATVRRAVVVRAGRSAHIAVALSKLPATLADGTYHLLVQVIDPDGYGAIAATTATVTVAAPAVDPSVSFARPPPSVIDAVRHGGTVILRIGDGGNVPAAGQVRITVSLDSTAGVEAAQLADVTRRLAIPVGRGAVVTVPLHAIGTLTAGTYQWAAQVTVTPVGQASTVDPTATPFGGT